MKFGMLVFPGSSCKQGDMNASGRIFGRGRVECWHKGYHQHPEGFAYGDYLHLKNVCA